MSNFLKNGREYGFYAASVVRISKISFAKFSIICLLIFSSFSGSLSNSAQVDVIDEFFYYVRQISLIAAIASVSWLFFTTPKLRTRSLPYGIYVPVAIAIASCLWSVAPGVSAYYAAVLAIFTLSIYISSQILAYEEIIILIRRYLDCLFLANLLAMLTPHGLQPYVFGMENHISGAWRGIQSHKNACGTSTSLMILLNLINVGIYKNSKFRFLKILCGVIFLINTRAQTEIIAFVVSLFILFVFLKLKSELIKIIIPITILLSIIIYKCYETNIDNIISIYLINPEGFSGRTQIWRVLIHYINENPYLGAGFGAFWNSGNQRPFLNFSEDWIVTYVAEGHNGYMDIISQIGFPGFLLFFMASFVIPLYRVIYFSKSFNIQIVCFLAIANYLLIQNLTEATFLAPGAISWLIYLAIFCGVFKSEGLSGIGWGGLWHRMRA